VSGRKNGWLVVYVLRVSVHRCDTQAERAGCYRVRQRSARDWYLTPGICPLDTYPVPQKTTIAEIVG